ncbi:MAG: RluA family pseudouridine synthase [Treponema sp.]|nr:RluA family pseudouridine synthase [Treponema sp.]
MPSYSCTVEGSFVSGIRLDRYVAEHLKLLSRSQIKARKLKALVEGRGVKISRLLFGGEGLDLSWEEAQVPLLLPQDLPLEVLYQDERVIVVNKAQGMVVHPGAGNHQGTLANALLYRRLKGQAPEDAPDSLRPGIVHRLDKDTSGLLIAAWDQGAHAFLAEQFKKRTVKKSYAALVQGCPPQGEGIINVPIIRSRRDRKTFTVAGPGAKGKGRPSLTRYKLVRSYGDYSLLLVRPRTGRTHQIRVHLRHLGFPILGDPIYGRRDKRFPVSLMLHAKNLSLILPGETQPRVFRSPLPERFLEIMHVLRS